MFRIVAALLAGLLLCAQTPMLPGFPPGTFQDRAAIDTTPAASYQGPGDVFTTSPYAGYSCARVFTAAQASTATSMCDLNAITGGAAVCTLRGSASGFVDQSAYCPGSLTPADACAAVGGCNISQAYDLTGNARHAVQATNATRPGITFSSTPTGTLPAIDCTIGTNPVLATGVLTQAQPLSASAVIIRTGGFTAVGGVFGANSSGAYLIQGTASANQVAIAMPTQLTATASDSVWHAINTLGNGVSSAINVDGSDATGNGGTSGLSAANLRLCRSGAAPYLGLIAEVWGWAAATNATDRGNENTNAHSSNGYGSF